VSPLKVSWQPEDELVLPALELLPDIDDLSRAHGTATCFPELEDGLVEELVEDGLVEDGLVEDEVLEDDDPELLNEITANSTFPELGLMIVSLIVPRLSPDEDCTEQLLS